MKNFVNVYIWPIVEADRYVAFLSGISMTGDLRNNIDVAYGLEKLIGWICAESLVSDEEINIVRNIARIVIAGDSVRITKKDEDDQRIEILASDHSVDKDAIEQFDKFLCRLVSTVSVDLMSGPTDPNTVLLPQQSIPRVIFPWARRFGKMFNTVTNPYKFSINGISFLGTSGQNICDLSRLTVGRSAIQLMADCLERSHIFPTVPDSLDGFPFEKRDPFILDEMPHVFFAGNQSELVHGWLDNASRNVSTLLLTVPAFRHKQTLTLLNLRNMRITEYDFSQNENFANILA